MLGVNSLRNHTLKMWICLLLGVLHSGDYMRHELSEGDTSGDSFRHQQGRSEKQGNPRQICLGETTYQESSIRHKRRLR